MNERTGPVKGSRRSSRSNRSSRQKSSRLEFVIKKELFRAASASEHDRLICQRTYLGIRPAQTGGKLPSDIPNQSAIYFGMTDRQGL